MAKKDDLRTIPHKQRISKTIETLIQKKTTNVTELLYLFSGYIASNPNFKYNVTYLTDTIDKFISDVNSYKKKYNFVVKILKNEVPKLTNSEKVIIYFDEVFELKYNSVEKKHEMKIKDEDNFDFRFDTIGDKSIPLQFKYEKIDHCYQITMDEQKNKNIKAYFKNFENAIISTIKSSNDEKE